MKAADYLRTAAEAIEQRGQLRDKPDGERSMERAVDAYITLNGPAIQTELDGWMFMAVLKLARATAGKPHVDDWTDLAGYAALAAECLEGMSVETRYETPDDFFSAMDKETKITPSSGDVFKDLNLADYAPEKTVFYGENANGPTRQPPTKWIPWQGGELPVPGQTMIAVRFRDGATIDNNLAGNYVWGHGTQPNPWDIVAYRVI